jgi:hypothetical protein
VLPSFAAYAKRDPGGTGFEQLATEQKEGEREYVNWRAGLAGAGVRGRKWWMKQVCQRRPEWKSVGHFLATIQVQASALVLLHWCEVYAEQVGRIGRRGLDQESEDGWGGHSYTRTPPMPPYQGGTVQIVPWK